MSYKTPAFESNRNPLPSVSKFGSVALIITAAAGLVAAFELSLDELEQASNPHAVLSCSVNVFIQCGKNLESAQGHLFGFPNPYMRLMGFPMVIIVAAGSLMGLKANRVFWWCMSLGTFLAVVFIAWLVTQSIFVLHTLCPWCCLVYAAVIPMSLVMTTETMKFSRVDRLQSLGRLFFPWVIPTSLVALFVIFVVAEIRLNILQSLL